MKTEDEIRIARDKMLSVKRQWFEQNDEEYKEFCADFIDRIDRDMAVLSWILGDNEEWIEFPDCLLDKPTPIMDAQIAAHAKRAISGVPF